MQSLLENKKAQTCALLYLESAGYDPAALSFLGLCFGCWRRGNILSAQHGLDLVKIPVEVLYAALA